jgi:hypothetical protein
MRVCIGLIMLAAYFLHSRLSQVEYTCALIKMEWLAGCIALRVVGTACICHFPPALAYNFAQSSSQWEAMADT